MYCVELFILMRAVIKDTKFPAGGLPPQSEADPGIELHCNYFYQGRHGIYHGKNEIGDPDNDSKELAAC
jgi:hypothetical protein